MILRHCSVENFGLLHEYELDLDQGFNSFLLDNGQGKSTLAGFIRAMFYGLEGDRRRSVTESDRKRYRPWQGGRFGGSLTFSCRGNTYRIERFFGLRKAEDTFTLTNMATGKEDGSFSERIGQELFGMDAESFTNTLLIGQRDLAVHITSDIHALLSPLDGSVSEPADIRNFRRADQALKDELNRLSPDRRTGEIYKKKEELSALDAEERLQSRQHSGRRASLEERIFGHKRESMSPDEMAEEADDLLSRLDWKFREGLPDEEELRSRIDDLQKDGMVPEEGDEITSGQPDFEEDDGARSRISAILACLIGLAGIAFLLLGHFSSGLHFTVPGGLLVFTAIFIFYLNLRSAQKQHGHSGSGDDRRDQMSEEGRRQKELARLLRLEKDVVLYQRLDDYRNLLAEEEEAAGKRKQKKEQVQEDLNLALHRYQVLSVTRRYLQQAKDLFSTELTDPLLASFKDYFCRVSGLKEIPFRLDTDLTLSLTDRGSIRDVGSLSQGWQDVAGLCMRLALIDAMYPDDPPCLILDDPFVNMDQNNIQACMDLITDLAARYQILYFTCHESRC